MALLTRAYTSFDHRGKSSKKIKELYLAKVRKYRVDLYIQLFLLRDRWQVPTNPLVPLTLDQFWLYAFSSQIADKSSLMDLFGFSNPLSREALKQGPGMVMGAVTAGFLKDGIKACFQQSLPIQHLDAESTDDLAWALRTQFYALDKECIDYTCIYRRPKGSKKDQDWTPLNPAGNNSYGKLKPISPYDQIRVLVVLKKNVSPGIYPISLQLFRTTGANISGPVYKEIVEKLDPQLLKHEARFKGRLGCVFHPFYCLGPKVVPGIKPLAYGHIKSGSEILYDGASFSYAFQVQVGGKRTTRWVKLGGPKCERSDLDEFPMSIDSRRDKDEKLLLEATFLKSRSKGFKYPRLFNKKTTPIPLGISWGTKELRCYGVGPLYIKYGKRGFSRAKKGMTFANHDWNTDVELVVLVWASETEIEKDRYRRLGQDWKKIPVGIQLINYVGLLDKDGPDFKSHLRYLGMLERKTGRFRAEYEGPDELEPMVRLLNDPLECLAIDGYIKGAKQDQPDKCHLFAAHFPMTYRTPAGKEARGIRPFARSLIKYPGYYRYSVINIATAADSGFSAEEIKDPDGEIELHFQAPRSYTKGVVWAGSSEEVIEKWITKLTTVNDPHISIFKKDD